MGVLFGKSLRRYVESFLGNIIVAFKVSIEGEIHELVLG